jgi:hypothetical protein
MTNPPFTLSPPRKRGAGRFFAEFTVSRARFFAALRMTAIRLRMTVNGFRMTSIGLRMTRTAGSITQIRTSPAADALRPLQIREVY